MPINLDTAATASYQQNVTFFMCTRGGNGLRDFSASTVSLNRSRVQNNVDVRCTSTQRCEDVAQCGCLQTRDDADRAWKDGQGALSVLVKQTLCRQLCF